MLNKVVFVEDEIVTREGIRDHVDWQGNGFELCGEEPDGEMALQLLRRPLRLRGPKPRPLAQNFETHSPAAAVLTGEAGRDRLYFVKQMDLDRL
jgi:hypothetical protein